MVDFTFQELFIHEGIPDPNHHRGHFRLLDFDGDGDLDLFITYHFLPLVDDGIPIRILLNDGEGNFSEATSTLFSDVVVETVSAREVLFEDFNGDGVLDIYIADHGYDLDPFPGAKNVLLLSSADGTFVEGNLPEVLDFSHSAAAGDIDGDGDLDLFVGNGFGGTPQIGDLTDPYILINDGIGNFSRVDNLLPVEVGSRSSLNSVYVTTSHFFDVDNDGDVDLLIGPQDNNPSEVTTATIYINPGNGDFLGAEKILLPRALADDRHQITLDIDDIDLNGDGYQDLIVNISDGYQTQYVQILINEGGSGFTDETSERFPQLPSTIPNWVFSLETKDFNNDGHLDILFSNSVDTHIALNDGRGNFHSFAENDLFYNGNETPHYLPHAYGDLNGDGLTDVLVYGAIADNAEVLFRYIQEDAGFNHVGSNVRDSFLGTSANETFDSKEGDDIIFAGAGNDEIHGGAGNDTIIAGEGNDTVSGGRQNDYIDGGPGNDVILGELGADRLYGGAGEDLLLGGNRDDQLFGEDDNDRVFGGNGNDSVDGGLGDDIMRGGNGDDFLIGDLGNDVLFGGTGRDTMFGTEGDDILFGRGGFDLLYGGSGNDTMEGGLQADQFFFQSTFDADVITDFEATNNAERIHILFNPEITDFDDLLNNHMNQVGEDVVIDDGTGTITLLGVNLSDLDSADFVF